MLGYLPTQRLVSLQTSMHEPMRSQCQYHFPTASLSTLQSPLLDPFTHKRSNLWIHSASTMFRHSSCLRSKSRGWTCLKHEHSSLCIHGGGTLSQRSVPPGGRHFPRHFPSLRHDPNRKRTRTQGELTHASSQINILHSSPQATRATRKP